MLDTRVISVGYANWCPALTDYGTLGGHANRFVSGRCGGPAGVVVVDQPPATSLLGTIKRRMVAVIRCDHDSEWAAMVQVAELLGGRRSRWVRNVLTVRTPVLAA